MEPPDVDKWSIMSDAIAVAASKHYSLNEIAWWNEP